MRRLKPPASPTGFLLRTSWKFGLGVGILAVLLTAGGVDRVQPNGHALATNVLPTTVPCGPIATDASDPTTATWTAIKSPYGTGSPYNLPVSTTNNTDPTVQPCDAIVVPHDVTLKIDASQGPVQIFSHGAAIKVDGGHLLVLGASETNSVLFDAEPDVASWIGITVNASDSSHRGNASLAYASIQHALNSITITSGATSTPDPTNPSSQLPFGLALVNSGIGPSYFDGIDTIDTPVLIRGHADPGTGRADGKFGTVNNIGSQGIKLTWDTSALPLATNANALEIDSVTFGSSVPFAETGCLPLQVPCSAGSIGNDAVVATFPGPNPPPPPPPPVLIHQSRFYRAGSFGVELNNALRPVIINNNFDCNGTGSPKPKETCVGTGLKYSAVYLNKATVDLENSVTNNVGHEDGLDAIVVNGSIVFPSGLSQPKLTWKNATNDPTSEIHQLGYLLDGDLNLTSGTFVVPGGSVVKSKGAINLTGAALDAGDTTNSGTKIFTSLRDNVNITSCPSVFVQSCPSPLPAGEWGGINLTGSATDATIRSATTGTITNAAILYATTGVHILYGSSLTVTSSAIGPTFADGVLAQGTALAVSGTTFGCPVGVCSGPSSGNHGILADFSNAGSTTGLKIGGPNPADKNTFQGSVNEAIRALGLARQPVDIENNAIQNAGATGSGGSAGIYLQGADNLILRRNDVVGSGTGNVLYPAIWLDGVSHADFSGPISANTGSGNGLNVIAFHGDAKTLSWQSVGTSGKLGFIVDGNLLIAGNLTLVNGDYAPVLGGTITLQGGALVSTGAALTSLKEQTVLPSCGSVFVQKASGVCPAPTPGDWGGLVLDAGRANQLTDSEIRYAVTGISVGAPSGSRTFQNLTMTRTNIRNTSFDGLSTHSPVSINGGAFTSNGGRGIKVDLTGVTPSAFQPLTISGHAVVAGSGLDGILAIALSGHTVQLQDASVDRSGAFGINLTNADHLTLMNNTVTNSAATFPAIYLNGFSGLFANISGNRGALNGVDAIAFHGTVTDDLTWQTAHASSDPTSLLGYILDNTLTMQSPHTLTVNAGDVVKVGNGGLLNLQGVNLKADDTGISSQKVFTSLTDDSVGVLACHSAVVSGCTGVAHPGDWAGIVLSGSGANGSLVNAAVRYATTGIQITSAASSTFGSSVFGLVVSGSSIGPTGSDGITAATTAISVTTTSFSGGTHGISVDFSGAMPGTPLRLSGNRFVSTSVEAILGQALGGQPVWITDNRIQGAGTYGIRLLNADQLVLRNNNVAGSGGGPSAGANRYPGIYLPAVSGDFTGNIRGNVGSGNGLDALVFDGKVTADLTWITPSNAGSTHALGYLLDGGLTLQGGKLVVGQGA
ncbi:MAG TPA: NosD domain-containing protein, partial [Candidatus Dormibacteraeota bacterium]|nr:NosD domain-containing protein [Candidatus Dormibacteraeota bacterium]